MYCTHCGKEVDDNAVVCVHCGCFLDGKTLNNSNAPAVQPPVEKKKTNVCALVGFILSLVGFVLGFYLYAVVIAGFIVSIIGMVQCKKYDGNGKGFAITGIVLGSIALVAWLIVLCIFFNLCYWLFWIWY